jgi:uncharacterized protein YcfJ
MRKHMSMHSSEQIRPRPQDRFANVLGPAIVGAAVGGMIGFLLRPAVPFIGQLPFGTVVMRGSNLLGLDVLLVGAAETSFNYLVAGLAMGAIAGALAGHMFTARFRT